jgi:hypothetical protein
MNRTDTGFAGAGRSIAKSLFLLVFGRDVTAALIRFILLAAIVAIHWVVTIVGLRFPGEIPIFWLRNLPQFTYPLLNIASTFLNPEVLLHLLPILTGLALGILIATRYLSDLFELDRFEIAWRYLTGAIYGLSTPRLRINSGEKETLDINNPIRRIGGPGVIQTHLGFAAVFENIEGIPSIYGLSQTPDTNRTETIDSSPATPRANYIIRGFERLRDVVDLRDRIARVNQIRAETLDGIVVVAQDAQMVFRVFGGEQERSLSNPYPFTEDAIRRIVYAHPVETSQRRTPADTLKGIVRTEIQSFVGKHTLDEFLALQPYRRLENRESQAADLELPIEGQQSIQIPRRELTERFHTDDLHDRLQDQGLELDWVGVGTWRISDHQDDETGMSTDQTLIRTWRDSQRLQLYRSPEYIQRQQQLALQRRPNSLIREWIERWESGELPPMYRCYELLSTIAQQLQALESRFDLASTEQSDINLLRNHIESLIDHQILGSDQL